MRTSIAFYISGHGFGHSTRTMAVINRIPEDFGVIVKTSAPRWLYDQNIRRQFDFHFFEGDVGAIQPNCLELDRQATLHAFAELARKQESQLEREARFLDAERVAAVAFDIPSVAACIAEKAGVPAIGFSNFSWDEIYAPYVEEFNEYKYLVDMLREQYSRTSLLLRLPFHLPMSAFPNREDWPLLARVSNADPVEIKQALGIPKESTVVLLSFGGIPLEGLRRIPIEDMGDFFFLSFFREPISEADNYRNILKDEMPHEDVVKTADVVISKPGYGIVSECIANKTAMIYAERQDFIEYPKLVQGIRAHLVQTQIPAEDLLIGRWKKHLETVVENLDRWEEKKPIVIDDGSLTARKIADTL